MKKLLLVSSLLFLFYGCAEESDIQVSKPTINEVVSSPLVVEGEARGSWFFEATFPAQLLDLDGNVIGEAVMQAQEDWQTEDFVTFEGVIEFTTDVEEGELVLRKDNPSGLPENDDEFRVPVKFVVNE